MIYNRVQRTICLPIGNLISCNWLDTQIQIFAGCTNSRKFISGYVFLMAGGAVSWKNLKQTLVASSIMEAEFVACYEASNQSIWLGNFVSGLQLVDLVERPLSYTVTIELQALLQK